jgi:anti-sigma factor RsiW
MHDPWQDRLSEYVDGDLAPATARDLEQHLVECDVCRSTVAELRDVVALARSVEDELPVNDLWAGIAARIGTPALPTTFEPKPLATRAQPAARRFTFSGTQLAIAALVLVSVTGSTVWLATKGAQPASQVVASGTIVQSAGDGVAQLVAAPVQTDPAMDATVAELERTLAENRSQLDPATVEIVERSITAIDGAIEDARKALQADPGNPFLSRQLDNTMRKKLDILQRATERRRAGT